MSINYGSMIISTKRLTMSFNHAVRSFSKAPACTDSYEELKNSCLQLAKTDPDNAAAYFLVFGFARSYVLLYDEDAVSKELAQRAKRQLIRYLEILASAIGDGSATARLSALNAVAFDYLQSERIF